MTLRLRLVVALTALVTAGLAVFGAVTYTLYAHTQYDRLDEQLAAALPPMSRMLAEAAGLEPSLSGATGLPGSPPMVAPVTVYGQLSDASGQVLAELSPSDLTATPVLPATIESSRQGVYDTVASSDGDGSWRTLSRTDFSGNVTTIAVPTSEVRSSLDRLLLIEGLTGAVILVLLASGSWFVLRRGLRPLEKMAGTAQEITAGDLDARVDAGSTHSEVDELGRAINSMLDSLQLAFAERDATEQRLRQFLADASHELRTPLTSIRGFAELFRLGADRDHVDQTVIVRRIESEADRMAALVEDLLLLARLDETRPLVAEPVDLSVLAADACSDAVAIAPDREVVLDAPSPVVVRGSDAHLRQAIANLVSNAVTHTPAGTRLEVRSWLEPGETVVGAVSVRDHGPGLDDDALAHVFDRFWQADRARSGRGAGLGLAIVAAIAKEHGGTVTAVNAVDGGAIFTLRIPI